MKNLLPLAKSPVKKTFEMIRERSPLFCTVLKTEALVTRLFFDHISFAKRRNLRDLMQRLLIVPFVEEILEYGAIENTRKKDGKIFHRIFHQKAGHICVAIVMKRKEDFVLLSCFIRETYHKQKRPVLGNNANSSASTSRS